MMRLTFSLPVAIVLLACGTAVVNAQTTSPTGPAGGQPAAQPAADQSPRLGSPENLVAYLQRLGHTVQTQTRQDGGIALFVAIRQNDWTYTVEIPFNANRSDFSLICPLGSPASQLSPAQMLALLKANARIRGYFLFRESDQRLCLEDDDYSVRITEAGFRSCLDRFLQAVHDNHNIWDTTRWPLAGPALATGANGVNTGSAIR